MVKKAMKDASPAERSPSNTIVETNEMVLLSHTNSIGTIFGGVLMSWIDIVAAICAQRYAGRIAVTASVDALNFLSPARVGDTVTLRAQVVYTGKTSMMISVDVDAENPLKRDKRRCVTALLTFVAVDEKMKPTLVPPLTLTTDEEKQVFDWASERRRILLDQMRKRSGSPRKPA